MRNEVKMLFRDPHNWREHPLARGLAGLEPELSALETETVDLLLSRLWDDRRKNGMQMWCLNLAADPPTIVVRVPLNDITEAHARGLRELTQRRVKPDGAEVRLVTSVKHASSRETKTLPIDVSVSPVLTFEARLRFNLRDEEDEEHDW